MLSLDIKAGIPALQGQRIQSEPIPRVYQSLDFRRSKARGNSAWAVNGRDSRPTDCAYRKSIVTLRPPNGLQNTSVCAFLTRGLEDSRKIVCLQRSPTICMLMPGRVRTVLEAITELGGIVRWTGSASRGAEFKRRAEARQTCRTATTAPRSGGSPASVPARPYPVTGAAGSRDDTPGRISRAGTKRLG